MEEPVEGLTAHPEETLHSFGNSYSLQYSHASELGVGRQKYFLGHLQGSGEAEVAKSVNRQNQKVWS
jgi:hypothetical protein